MSDSTSTKSKSLKDKAIDIKGKQYVLVADRIIYFNENYPNGSIQTELLSEPDAELVVVKAYVFPGITNDDIATEAERESMKMRKFTGYSQAKWGEGFINKTAALENAETSAVGRALAMMGIGVIDSVASVDEMNKAGATPGLDEVKAEVFAEFKKREASTEEMMDVIDKAINKASIRTVEEGRKVLDYLKDN